MAQYPSQVPVLTTKSDGAGNYVLAAHVNDLQNEVIALAEGLLNGVAHNLVPAVTNLRDLGTTGSRFKDLYLSGAATITGAVTAASFTGDGSGLTSVPISGNINDLADVSITTPSNGHVLTYNSGTGDWENAAPAGGGGGATQLNDLTDVTLTTPSANQVLQYNGSTLRWENTSPTSIPAGLVAPYGGAAAPSGWLLCDGSAVSRTTYAALFTAISTTFGVGDGVTTFNVPDMRGVFPLGKAAAGTGSTLGGGGGALDHTHTTSAHTHGAGSYAAASHSHAAGTLVGATHTHGVGTLVSSSHTHAVGTLTVASHSHGIDLVGGALSGGAHTHTGTTDATDVGPVPANLGDLSEGTEPVVESLTTGSHTHTFTTGSDGAHTHNVEGTSDGATASITGVTAATTPTLSGNTAASGTITVTGSTTAAAPAVSGTSASGGGSDTGANNPAFLTLNFIIKT